MKHISNLIFAVAFVGMSGFWALALTGHLPAPAPPPPSPSANAATTGAPAPAQESIATVTPPTDKESGGQKDSPVEAVSAPIEKGIAPLAPAKTKALASKSEKPRSKKPVKVRTRDRTPEDKS